MPAAGAVNPTNGDPFRYTTHAWGTTGARPGSMNTLTEPRDANGAPYEFITQNAKDGNGERHPLWPDSVLPHANGTDFIVYYQKVHHTTHVSQPHVFINEGTYVADMVNNANTLVRTGGNEVAIHAGDARGMTSGSLYHTDGYIYLYSTGVLASLHHKISRVLRTQYKTPGSYQYWDGDSWVADITQAKYIVMGGRGYDGLGGMAGLTVSWNAYLDKFVMVHSHAKIGPYQDTVCIRTADAPQGPWSLPAKIKSVPDSEPTVYGLYTAREHRWAQENSGRVIWITHGLKTPGAFTGQLQIVKVEFGAP
jgi:hypothetical protein